MDLASPEVCPTSSMSDFSLSSIFLRGQVHASWEVGRTQWHHQHTDCQGQPHDDRIEGSLYQGEGGERAANVVSCVLGEVMPGHSST